MTETVEQFLKRGGKIQKCDASHNRDANLRYRTAPDNPHRQTLDPEFNHTRVLWHPIGRNDK